MYRIISTSKDRNGQEFIATIEAVQNDHKFPTRQQEENALIYKHSVTYTERLGTSMQVYYFINRNPYQTKFYPGERIDVSKDIEQ
ncbi:hypothetical protein AC249_AIPGENE21235 [Exaiptasia diaphana]|nr:hypothetical protein AC249_AIPGENE21235 [Exaiptasia diaphana]